MRRNKLYVAMFGQEKPNREYLRILARGIELTTYRPRRNGKSQIREVFLEYLIRNNIPFEKTEYSITVKNVYV